MINVSCTCGSWQIDADDLPDQCPKCGAVERFFSKGTDYVAEPWEELDVRGRMWGVFGSESESPTPVAIFSTEQDAANWLAWQEFLGDDSTIGNIDYVICPIDRLEGHAWNSHEGCPPEVPNG